MLLREPNSNLLGKQIMLMSGIQNVQRLNLPSDTLEVLSLCTESIPVFNKLRFLGVWSEQGRGWQAMPALLRNCPHLETLIMEGLLHTVTDKCGDACLCIVQEDEGRSLKSCLVNRLEIKRFRGTMKEMAMVKHFLDYFPCLKRMDVFIKENDPTQLRHPEEIIRLLFKRWRNCCVQLTLVRVISLDKKVDSTRTISEVQNLSAHGYAKLPYEFDFAFQSDYICCGSTYNGFLLLL